MTINRHERRIRSIAETLRTAREDLEKQGEGIALHAEQFDQAVRELKMEEALAILRVLQSDLEITEQGLIRWSTIRRSRGF